MALPDEQDPQHGQPAPDMAVQMAALTARVGLLEQQLAALHTAPPKVYATVRVEPAVPPVVSQPVTPSPPPPAAQSLENRLGSQVFSRIGIIALLVGVAAFLKLAIDNQWLGETGQVVIGLAAGTAIVLWSERFRRKGFAAFSYSLKAVGSGVLYLSLWAAFQLYHLLPAPVALGCMILVTAWNAWMAWAQDAELLAGYALVGAFATPLLLSTGGNHELFLFTYLAAIDICVVALLEAKPWYRLLLGAVPATFSLYAGWFVIHYSAGDAYAVTFFFILLFFSIFSVPSQGELPADEKKRASGETMRLLLALANAAFVAVALYALLNDADHRELLPWAMVAIAGTYLVLTRFQRNALTIGVHLSLAVVFLTIAIPLKASGRWITIGWLVEGVALLRVASKLGTSGAARDFADGTTFAACRLLRLLGLGALAIGFIGLVSLPWWLFSDPQSAFFNERFATALVGLAVFGIATWIALHAPEIDLAPRLGPMIVWPVIAAVCVVAINVIALQAGVLEIETFWRIGAPPAGAQLQTALSVSAFLMLYGAALLAVGFRQRSGFLRWQALGLLIFTIAKTFLYDVRSLSEGYRVASFLGLGALLMGISFAYQKDWLCLKEPEVQP